MRQFSLIHGDCVEAMLQMPADSVDAIVTDPPYGLGFMGKKWDALPPGLPWAEECLRVLKPGGHIVAFGGQRTIHRLTCALEDAGFEIRDLVGWLQWQGFPKSLDVSKAIDAAAGAEREVVGSKAGWPGYRTGPTGPQGLATGRGLSNGSAKSRITAPATDDAKRWNGWGTALKPCIEPATLARKPLSEGTVAANVLRWGTGALNIDGCRYAYGDEAWPGPCDGSNPGTVYAGDFGKNGIYEEPPERWSAGVTTSADGPPTSTLAPRQAAASGSAGVSTLRRGPAAV